MYLHMLFLQAGTLLLVPLCLVAAIPIRSYFGCVYVHDQSIVICSKGDFVICFKHELTNSVVS